MSKKVKKKKHKKRTTYAERNPLLYAIRTSDKYKQWRTEVCKSEGVPPSRKGIEVHHKKPLRVILKENKIVTYKQAMDSIPLWDISNGVVLKKGEHIIITWIERHKHISIGFVGLIKKWLVDHEDLAETLE